MIIPDISVVIALEDRVDALPTVLSYFERQQFPASRYEVLLVPYAAHSKVAAMAARYSAGLPVPVDCIHADVTTSPAAKNLGARNARGLWLIFLDQDLIPGASLLAAHVKKQRANDGRAVILGSVAPYHNLPRGALTRWFMRHDKELMAAAHPESPLHWSSRHCSLPRRLFLDRGGFDETLVSARAADLELAWRMREWGCPMKALARVEAFIWRAARFSEERRRFMRDGYELYALAERLAAPEIIAHFRLSCSRLRYWYEAQFAPFYANAFEEHILDMRLHGQSCRRIFSHDMRIGARAARLGRPLPTF